MAQTSLGQQRPILILDDDELVRWSVGEGLRELGYQVAVAGTAQEALRRCTDASVVLLDCDLPDPDGLTVAENLRRRHPGCTVVLTTAYPTSELDRRAREQGIAGVVGKPFLLEALTAAIRDALEGRRAGPLPGPSSGQAGPPGGGP